MFRGFWLLVKYGALSSEYEPPTPSFCGVCWLLLFSFPALKHLVHSFQAPSEVVSTHTIDNITYTIISSSSPTATQTLQSKLGASIGRDIAHEIARIT